MSYERMLKDFSRMKKRKRASSPVTKKRQVNPTSFSFYTNPLEDLTAIVPFLLDIQQKQKQDMHSSSKQQMNTQMRMQMMMQMMYRSRGRMNPRMMQMFYESEQLSELQQLVKNQINKQSIYTIKQEIHSYFDIQKRHLNETRSKTLKHISKAIQMRSPQYQALQQIKPQQKWNQMNKIIQSKIDRQIKQYYQRFYRLTSLNGLPKNIVSLIKDNKMPSFSQLSIQKQNILYKIVLQMLSIPSKQYFLKGIQNLQSNFKKVLQGFLDEDAELLRVLDDLPYKQSSFYWSKIIECCRHISSNQNHNDHNKKIQQFQAEFCGTITIDTQKKCADGQWLDNTITSGIIQYLKHIEGANNYHDDDNFKGFLFNHSQTDLFLNSNKETNINYSNYDKLIFLVNIENAHWLIIAVYNITNEIVIYNSMDSHDSILSQYCQKIKEKLKKNYLVKKNMLKDYKICKQLNPRQKNGNDCGVFAIINFIMAFDKQPTDSRKNNYDNSIISQIRNSLLLFLQYLGYCKKFVVVPRKDYFDVLFRSTIYFRIKRRDRR